MNDTYETYKRSPIVCVMGHIDAGKTSLLDKIRGTAVQKKEAGGITQHIGASFFPIETIKSICGPLLSSLKVDITIPGLLVIDTPGHEAFINLRKRGGSVSDIAILVVDVLKGLQSQTYESLNILKDRKTPFIVAANKIDMITGWQKHEGNPFLVSAKKQDPAVLRLLDEKIYSLIGELSQEGFSADRFDRIKDFTKTVAIIPTSAKTGEGIPELLMVLVGLTQQYMAKKLVARKGPGMGVILEVRDEVGLGRTIDVILYDGVLRKGDTIVVGGLEKPFVTKIRALLQPKPLDEIRSPQDKFNPIDEVSAAAGIKIVAPGLDNAIAGAPVRAVWDKTKLDEIFAAINAEVQKLRVKADKLGVVIKTDTLGSLEAIVDYFTRFKVPIRLADVGDVSRRDIVEAAAVKDKDPYLGVVLAFNVKINPDALEKANELQVKLFTNKILYRLFEEYDLWVREQKELEKRRKLEKLVLPAKIKVLPGYVFRISKPAIVGVKVLGGRLQSHVNLITESGKPVGEIMQIQDKGKSIKTAPKDSEVAISIKGAVVGKHFNEGDTLYVDIPLEHIKILKNELLDTLTTDDIEIINELRKIKRKPLV